MRISPVFFALYISFASAKEGSFIRGELKDESVGGEQVDVDVIIDPTCALQKFRPWDCLGKKDIWGNPCYVCGSKNFKYAVCVNTAQKKLIDGYVQKHGLSNWVQCDKDS